VNGLVGRGWDQIEPQAFKHPCGARISRCGKQSWTAVTVAGLSHGGYATAEDAEAWLLARDLRFWSYGNEISCGVIAGIAITSGYLNSNEENHVVVCSLAESRTFPPQLSLIFKRHFLAKASCARCGEKTTEILLRRVSGANIFKPKFPTVVCRCGYPVWRISVDGTYRAERALAHSERMRHRRENLREAGGKHTNIEIADILAMQRNRCFYCNSRFDSEDPPTQDHLETVFSDGTEWALNIVMACRYCNGKRSNLEFHRYCAHLSLRQNQRILGHLKRRLAAIKIEDLPDPSAATKFCSILSRYSKSLDRRMTVRRRR
jgi:hypothetical protein